MKVSNFLILTASVSVCTFGVNSAFCDVPPTTTPIVFNALPPLVDPVKAAADAAAQQAATDAAAKAAADAAAQQAAIDAAAKAAADAAAQRAATDAAAKAAADAAAQQAAIDAAAKAAADAAAQQAAIDAAAKAAADAAAQQAAVDAAAKAAADAAQKSITDATAAVVAVQAELNTMRTDAEAAVKTIRVLKDHAASAANKADATTQFIAASIVRDKVKDHSTVIQNSIKTIDASVLAAPGNPDIAKAQAEVAQAKVTTDGIVSSLDVEVQAVKDIADSKVA